MPLKKSIGTRIFGLAIFLLTLTIVLVCFLLWEVAEMESGLQTLAHGDIPLASSLSRLDEYGLRRRLAFERMFGALNGEKPIETELTEARGNYELYTAKLREEIATARQLFARAQAGGWRSADLAGLAELLDEVEKAYALITARQQEVLEWQTKGDHGRAAILRDGLRDLQKLVQSQREKLQDGTASRAEAMAHDALQLQTRITWLSLAATTSTVLLGLVVAAWVTQELVRPVRSLIGAMGQVQGGKLDVELPVRGADEISALTAAFNFFVSELRAKARIKETFGKYVDPRILDRVLTSAGPVESTGERQVMTVSFGDLVGFTNCSERLTPTNMVRFLNRHFGLQTGAIQDCQGIVDKFMGDAVMAFWGPPFVAADEHARLACRSALAQLAALNTLRMEISELTGLRRDAPHIDLRLGIAAGEVIVGNIGGDQTRAYTVIGDTVNVASRIEAVNRIYGTNILVNEQVARDAGAEFAFRQVDIIAVKGRHEPVRIFELLGPAGIPSGDTLAARDVYESALKAYQSADWVAAGAGFEEALRLRPADTAARVMLERIAVLSAQAPGVAWDGVWKLTEK